MKHGSIVCLDMDMRHLWWGMSLSLALKSVYPAKLSNAREALRRNIVRFVGGISRQHSLF